MKKVEVKEKTIKDLEMLYEKYVVKEETDDEKKKARAKEWEEELPFNKLLVVAYRDSKPQRVGAYRIITDKLIVDDIWAHEVNDFNYGLKYYNINEFLFKDTSTQAMAILIKFLELGWEVVGTEDWGLNERYDFKENKRYYEPMTGIVLKRKGVEK